jgi:3-methyladenine DNA glycosylase AlkD
MPDPSKARVSPDAEARRAIAALKRAGRPQRAAGAAAYFKSYEKLRFFGVDSATVREIAARLAKEHSAEWTLRDAVAFADAMIARRELEAKGVGICVLGRFRRRFEPSLLADARGWLAKHCTDWASTDNLCGEVLGPLLVDRPELWSRLRAWRRSRALYVRRASAVALIAPVRRHVPGALAQAYSVAVELGEDSEDLIQKALGWLLREAGKADVTRLERFLREHGTRLGRTTVRYAIERFAPGTRRELLEVTKGGSGLRHS